MKSILYKILLVFFLLQSSVSFSQCGLDVFIANDQSGSVDDLENIQGRHFITTLMDNLQPWGTANNQSRMAVAQWADNSTWVQYTFPSAGNNYTTKLSDIIDYQNSARFLSGGTDPYDALLKTYAIIEQTAVVGRTAPKILILLTDAYCEQVQSDIVNLATQIKNNGVYIMVLAVAEASSCTILQGTNIASGGGYFSAPTYAELEQLAITKAKAMIQAACIGPPPPTFDLTINLNNFTASNCNPGPANYKIDYNIKNIGKLSFNNNLTISFYNGDPTLPTTQLVAVQNAGNQNIAVNGNYVGSFTSNLLKNTQNLYAIVNFDGGIASNAVPLPYDLINKLKISGEGNVNNNMSNGITRTNDNSCSPTAILNVDVNAGGIGCGNTVNYEVEICNTGDATAIINSINPVAANGFILKSVTPSIQIDTTLRRKWATYYGGTTGDAINSMAVDNQGNIYITGHTSSTNNISTTGSYQPNYAGSGDAFIAKFNSDGVRQWATYYGGSSSDDGISIATDAQGNVFIVGRTSSQNGIATIGAAQTTKCGSADVFLVKFDSDGNRLWGTFFGSGSNDYGEGVSTDNQGNVYITGVITSSTCIPMTAGAHQPNFGGYEDAFLVKYNSAGVIQWSTYYGGSNYEYGHSIKIDTSGNVYLTGITRSSNNISTSGSFQQNYNGGSWIGDAFLVKFNSIGVRQWSTYYGGTDDDYGSDIGIDPQGNIIMVGYTSSTTNISTAGAHQIGNGGYEDAFITKFSSSGIRLWGSYYGGSSTDRARSISIDAQGNLFMVGNTYSNNNISTNGSYQINNGGNEDEFLVKFNSNGVRQWGTYYGGSSIDGDNQAPVGQSGGPDVAIDLSGNIYISGETWSSDNISSSGSHQPIFGGPYTDGFLVRFGNNNLLLLPPDSCITRQYIYSASGVAPGTYDFSNGVIAQKYLSTDGTPIILPDSNFTVNSQAGLNGFNGANHTSDNVTIVGNNPACISGDKVTVSVSIPTASACGGGGTYAQATVTINNTSGVTIFNPVLFLNLTGAGAIFAGELYNISNNLSIAKPNVLATNYPNIPNALFGKNGIQNLNIYQLPAGTSTFNIDINLGTSLANLGVRIDSLPTIFNASGKSNLATDAGGVSIAPIPAINGFTCPSPITVGANIVFTGISTVNASTVKWSSSSVSSIPNGGSVSNPSLNYTPTSKDIANGYVDIALTATTSTGCDATKSCQIKINNVEYDYGDAPISYDLNKNNIPYAGSSTILSGINLGINPPTTESTTKNSIDAKGDGNEEDGLLSANCTSKPINLQAFPLQLKATNTTNAKAYINAFADWNNDGDYLDDGETAIKIGLVPNNSNTQNYTLNFIPQTANVSLNQYYVRLRISTDSNSIKRPYEPAPQGETEDHLMKLGLSASYTQLTDDICQGDSIKVNNHIYKISGTYFDTLMNSVGCDSIITTKLNVNPKYLKTQQLDLCQGESVKVGNNTYTQTGNYTDSLKTTKNCDSVIVTNLIIHLKQVQSQSITICPGSSYTIGSHTYTQQGTYKDTLKTNFGCDSIVTSNITIAALQTVNKDTSICSDQKLVIGTHIYTTNGIYKDTIKGSAGCDTVLTTHLIVFPKPVVNLGNDLTICEGTNAILDAGNLGANYHWNTNENTQHISVSNTGKYIVTVSKNNCSASDTAIVTVQRKYFVNIGNDTTICKGDSLVINVSIPSGMYTWQDASTSPIYAIKNEGTYSVSVKTDCNTSSDEVKVSFLQCDCEYYIPNAFSPNNDGVNDKYGVLNECENVQNFKFKIFNRWGELLFETDNPLKQWDGRFKGQEQPMDSYPFILSYKQNNKEYYNKGICTLLR